MNVLKGSFVTQYSKIKSPWGEVHANTSYNPEPSKGIWASKFFRFCWAVRTLYPSNRKRMSVGFNIELFRRFLLNNRCGYGKPSNIPVPIFCSSNNASKKEVNYYVTWLVLSYTHTTPFLQSIANMQSTCILQFETWTT